MSPNLNTGGLGLGITIMLCSLVLGTAVYLISRDYGMPVMICGYILGVLVAIMEIIQAVRKGE